MLFTDIVFAPFLIVTFLAFALVHGTRRGQLVVLLVASYVFYGWWNVQFLVLIVFSSLLDFHLGRALFRTDDRRLRRFYLGLSLLGNLGLLGYFKYANFFISSAAVVLGKLGFQPHLPTLEIVLPIGISFYTFQTLSYTLDIYFRRLEPTESRLEFLVFVAAFPQLVAGPIVRARTFLPQLRENLFARSNTAGLVFVFYGLGKKMFVADYLGAEIVDRVFATPLDYSWADTLLAVQAYSFQIFLDFSAYSDIAVGLGLLFGLRLPRNFRMPFSSQNPSEFWRRWHITLSTWLRDYLYIPLGGNRASASRVYMNLMVVMLVGGLWHGAVWTFVVWGALHGAYLVLHRLWSTWRGERRWRLGRVGDLVARGLRVLLCFELIALTFLVFRAPDFQRLSLVVARLFDSSYDASLLGALNLAILGTAIAIHYACEPWIMRVALAFGELRVIAQAILVYATLVVFFLLSRHAVTQQAFIYFQF